MKIKDIHVIRDPINQLPELRLYFDNEYAMSLIIRPNMTALQLAAELNSMAHHLFERLAKEKSLSDVKEEG